MKLLTGMRTQTISLIKSAKVVTWKKLSEWLTALLRKSKVKDHLSNTDSTSSQDQKLTEGLFRDKDGSLVMVTKLNDDEFLFNHETEGSAIVDKYGKQIVGK